MTMSVNATTVRGEHCSPYFLACFEYLSIIPVDLKPN